MLDAAGLPGGGCPSCSRARPRRVPVPVGYPTSCSPQAWAAAAPLLFLRTLLRFDPWVPHGKLWLDPGLPSAIGYLRVDRIPLLGSRVTVEVDGGAVKVEGLPAEIEVVAEPRGPISVAARRGPTTARFDIPGSLATVRGQGEIAERSSFHQATETR